MYDIVIIGAGPAGLMAAIESYTPGKKILILERMPRPALKLRMTGKGRCNITNDAPLDEFIAHFGKNGRFLRYAFTEFFNSDLLTYFERLGVQFKLERGGRYFPQNDKAMDIVLAMLERIKSLPIQLYTDHHVTRIIHDSKRNFVLQVRTKQQQSEIRSRNIVIATGGRSYPNTGSNGSGYKLARLLGHIITPVFPALVPLNTTGDMAKKLEGLSLKNARVTVWSDNKKAGERFGEMLFTNSGVSGPIILALSGQIVKLMDEKHKIRLTIDLKPALDTGMLDQRLLREITDNGKQNFSSLLKKLLPQKMIAVFIEALDIPGDKKLSHISADERKRIRMLLKELSFDVNGYRSYDEAIITSGGISIREINPATMESKLVPGLYFSGEVIDIDADTGGFNLQAAFSTGWVAGQALRKGSHI